MHSGKLDKAHILLRGSLKQRGRLPKEVQLEITNRCNFACTMCPRQSMEIPETDMADPVLARAIENLAGVDAVVLSGWGEPLAHAGLPGVLARIREAHPAIAIELVTNGSMLKGAIVDEILKHDVTRLSVSLDRVMKLTGHDGHRTPGKVAVNLRRFARTAGDDGPAIGLKSTLGVGTLYDLFDVVEFAVEIGAAGVHLLRLDTRFTPDLDRPPIEEEREFVAELKRRAVGRVPLTYDNDDRLTGRLATHGETVCLRTVYHAYVTVDGDVTPCSLAREHTMGNLVELSLSAIWRGEAFKRFFREQSRVCGNCDLLTCNHRIERTQAAAKQADSATAPQSG